MKSGVSSRFAWRVRVARCAVSAAAIVAATSASAQEPYWLDGITILASKVEERAIDALAPVSTIREGQIDHAMAVRTADVFRQTPGVNFQERADEVGTSVNVRGLQDFGRVAVVIDGARQNFQRTGHFGNGSFYFDPELLAAADVVRGPTANIYGSGAIGGVVSLRTKDVDDILRPGERWGAETHFRGMSNLGGGLVSTFAAFRPNANVDYLVGGSFRSQQNYEDGSGFEIPNSGNEVTSALVKATFRPSDGHQIKLSHIFYDADYSFGQPPRDGQSGSSVYATDLRQYTTNARWQYSKPDDKLFDFDVNVYWNRSISEQIKTLHTTTSPNPGCGGVPGNPISGCIGAPRSYTIDTIGFDAHNTSRVDAGAWRHAFTYGGDAFTDEVETIDATGASDATTPSGKRTVAGGFFQWKANYSTWFEVIGAVRYDHYELTGLGTHLAGDRLSPKITVGVTPFPGFTPYVSYAEGYRAPSLTETIISGAHPSGGGPSPRTCDDGTTGYFCFLPNPSLEPEVGKNKEIGINLARNDVFRAGDAFRGKFNLFRNDIDNYIELTAFGSDMWNGAYGPPFYQYQNVRRARVQGFEFETTYDTGDWFAGLSGHVMESRNEETGYSLVTVTPLKIATTLGARFFDRKLTVAVHWAAFGAAENVPPTFLPSDSYNLVNVYVAYQPSPNVTASFSVENLLDEYYLPYSVPQSTALDAQRDTLWAAPGRGLTFKGGLKVRFGDATGVLREEKIVK